MLLAMRYGYGDRCDVPIPISIQITYRCQWDTDTKDQKHVNTKTKYRNRCNLKTSEKNTRWMTILIPIRYTYRYQWDTNADEIPIPMRYRWHSNAPNTRWNRICFFGFFRGRRNGGSLLDILYYVNMLFVYYSEEEHIGKHKGLSLQ